MRVVNHHGEILLARLRRARRGGGGSGFYPLGPSRNISHAAERFRDHGRGDAERAGESRGGERVLERELARKPDRHPCIFKRKVAAFPARGKGRACGEGEGERMLDGKRQVAAALLVVRVRDDDPGPFSGARDLPAKLELRVGVRFVRAVRFDVLGGEVGEYERVEVEEAVPVLPRALGCHFEDSGRASATERVVEKFLDEKPARHRHARRVRARVFALLESYRVRDARRVPGFFEDRAHHLGYRGFAFRAGNADDEHRARRVSVPDRRERGEREMVGGEGSRESRGGNHGADECF